MIIEKIASNLESRGYKVRQSPTLTGASGSTYTPALYADSETPAVVSGDSAPLHHLADGAAARKNRAVVSGDSAPLRHLADAAGLGESRAVVNFDSGQAQFSTIILTHLMSRDLNVAGFVYADEFSEDEKNWALNFGVHLLGRGAVEPPAPPQTPPEPRFPAAFELLSGFDTELRVIPKVGPEFWLVGCEAAGPLLSDPSRVDGFLTVEGPHRSSWLNWLAEVDKGLAMRREAEQAPPPQASDALVDKVLLAEAAPPDPLASLAFPEATLTPAEDGATPVTTTPPAPAAAPAHNGRPESPEMKAHRHGDLIMV